MKIFGFKLYKRTPQSAQQELAGLRQRINLATAYVEEQIALKLEAAVKATMKAKNVDLVLSPQAVIAREPHVDITDAIVIELNKLVPSVSITPPADGSQAKQISSSHLRPSQQAAS